MDLRTDPLPRWAGFVTFGRAPQGDLETLRPGMIAVAGVTYDLSCTGMIGARYGPRQIRESSNRISSLLTLAPSAVLDGGGEPFAKAGVSPVGRVVDLGDLNEYPTDWTKTEAAVRRSMHEIARRGATPLVFGGDRLNSFPLFAGYAAAMAEQGKTVGYISFSSQLDLGDTDPLWGTAWRGSTAKRILDSGLIRRHHMVWVGTSGYLPRAQVALTRDLNLHVFSAAQVRREGIDSVTRQALDHAGDGTDVIYVGIDLDVLDGVHVQSMSTPTFEGLKNRELDRVMGLLADDKVKGLDITGCNPILEYRVQGRLASQLTAFLAFHFIMRAVRADA